MFTLKQEEVLERLINADFHICGLHGAKRSGKTFVNNITFLSELDRVRRIADDLGVEEPLYILAGTTSASIQNNILQDLFNFFGIEVKYDKHGAFKLRGVKIIQIYTGSIDGLNKARGFTAYGAYINEASLANQAIFKEIINRCSGEGARIVWDSNPDNPSHWLKKDYIDKSDDNIINFHFKLDDNTFLSQRYIDNIKNATPSGVFYDRDILGKWSVAEGAIYSDYDKNIHEVEDTPPLVKYFAGVDWGYDHYGTIVVVGEDTKGNQYLVDGIAEQYKEIDYWVNRAKEIKEEYGNIKFYADSARPEHVARFKREGLNVEFGNKSVIAGIEIISKKFKSKTLFIKKGSIPRFFDEIYQYKWKPNSTKDEPLKEYDDVLDALRYAIYSDYVVNSKEKRDVNKDIKKVNKYFRR